MPVAPALLIEPNDEAAALLRDQRLGERHLLAAVTFKAVEDVGTHTVRVHATEDLPPLFHLTHHQGNALPLPIIIEDLLKRAEHGVQRPFRQTREHVVLPDGGRSPCLGTVPVYA